MYRQEFYIVAKKDEEETPNYHKLIALRTDRAGEILSEKDKWTDNIFLAKHFRNTTDAVDYASKQLNTEFVCTKKRNVSNLMDSGYKIVKVFFDIEANSEITSILYTQ